MLQIRSGKIRAYDMIIMTLISVLWFVGSAAVTRAQQEVQTMKEVRVVAESMDVRLSGDLAKYGSQVEVITEEDMDKAGVTDINEALNKLVPGVHVPSTMGPFSGARVNIQGGTKRDVIWLLDGVRLSNRSFTTFRNNIAPQYIQRIEVIKGPQSIIYGSQGITAVINIITKDIQPPGEGAIKVDASAGARDYFATSQHGDMSGQFGSHAFTVFGNSNFGQNQPFKDEAFDTTVSRSAREREFEVQNIGAKYRYDLGSGEDLLLFTQLNRADLDWVRPHNLTQAGNERIQSISYLKWNKNLSPATNLFAKAYYHRWDSDWTFIGQDNAGNAQAFSVDDQWYFDELGLTTMIDQNLPGGSEWIGGLDLKQYSGKNNIGVGFPEITEQLVAPFVILRPKIPLLPTTNVGLGARYSMLDETENNFAWNASARRPLPSIGRWIPFTDSFDVRMLVGEGFSLPKSSEISTTTEPGFTATLGNPDLEAIESTSYEIGVEGTGSVGDQFLTYQLNYFHRENDQQIVTVFTDASRDTRTFVNSDGTEEADGVEANFLLSLHTGWRIQLSGTYLDVSDSRSRNTDGNDQASNRPEWIVKSILRYDHPGGRWGAQFTGNYVDEMQDVGDRLDAGLSPGLDPEFGDYFVADLAAYVHLDEQNQQKVSLAIENLFNKEYAAQLDEGTRVDGSPFRFERLGPPLNITLKYVHRF